MQDAMRGSMKTLAQNRLFYRKAATFGAQPVVRRYSSTLDMKEYRLSTMLMRQKQGEP